MTEQTNIGEIIRRYVELRDSLSEWKKKMDEEERARKTELEKIEVQILQKADELGVDSFKTEHGTAYKTTDEHFRIDNWEEFVDYVKKTDNFSLFQKRVTKTVAKEVYTETGELPGGVGYFQEFKINIRRPTGGSKKEVV